jgi:urease accessory protein
VLPPSGPGWHGSLRLNYRRSGHRTVAHDRHQGPLRVLRALYPEGDGICHHVVVHPPGGVVGGDTLQIEADLGAGTHALITTPGATRFYRCPQAPSQQSAVLRLGAGARLEWLPLEAIAYSGCRTVNSVRVELEPGAEMMGWDVLALGLEAGRQAFDSGWFRQQLEWPGVWLERGLIAAGDEVLLRTPLGWGGHKVLATAWWAAGTPLTPARRDALLEAARARACGHALAASAGASAPNAAMVVVRVLAPGVESAMGLLQGVRAAWRELAWGLAAAPPRIWRT